jgi:hypothetical protein
VVSPGDEQELRETSGGESERLVMCAGQRVGQAG